MVESGEITSLLQAGGNESLDKLLPLIYDELKRMAASIFRNERSSHTLQPTALVHEAYLKLSVGDVKWQNRAHFFGIAANAMRQILVNHAKARNGQKRGGGRTLLALDSSVSFSYERDIDLLAINELLDRLARLDPRQAKLTELRFFGGLTVDEAAVVMGTSAATLGREWKMAKSWLYRELTNGVSK